MGTPYEHGYTDGQWTDEQIAQCGFDSAAACLEHQEGVLQEERDGLMGLYEKNPEYAAQHAEYLEGITAGTRDSLRGR